MNPLLTSLLFTHSILSLFSSCSPCVSSIPLRSIFLLLFGLFVQILSPFTSSLPHAIHHGSSHLDPVRSLLLSTCFHFLNCIHSIIFALSPMAIFHWLSFIHSYVTLSGFTSLLSPTPGGLYFMQPSRSWANITVLVGAVDWVTAVCVLPTRMGQRSVSVQETKL